MAIEVPVREPCPFCTNIEDPSRCAFIVREGGISSFVNPRQYEHGALLVIPDRHAPTLFELDSEEVSTLFLHARNIAGILRKAYDPIGLNLYTNNGIAAGQTVPHVHIHVVPRYPTSIPNQIFSEHMFENIPVEKRFEIAEEIRQYL